MQPLVSVIMTAYNEERYIAGAIKSILNQTYKNIELIIVNDGSIDRTLDIINNFSDPKIKLINNKRNLGAAESSNIGIEIAKGKYIARMDADDISLPSRIEKQVNFLEYNTRIHVIGTWIKIIYEGMNESNVLWKYDSDPEKIRSSLIFNPGVAHPTLMFRREVLINTKYNKNLDSAIDYDLYSSLPSDIKFSNIKEALLFYRRHDNQMSTGIASKQQQNAKKIRRKMLRKIEIIPTDRELEMHQQISNNKISNYQLSEVITWLEKLVFSNSIRNYFNEEDFKEIISNKLINLINNNDKYDKYDSINYYKSFLSNGKKLPEDYININKVIEYLISKGISNIAIFGTKRSGLFLHQQLTSNGIRVKCFLDNYTKKHGRVICNNTIETPKWLIENKGKLDAVIISIIGEHSKKVFTSLNKLTNGSIAILDWKQLMSISRNS